VAGFHVEEEHSAASRERRFWLLTLLATALVAAGLGLALAGLLGRI
jgi:hypothetical protein